MKRCIADGCKSPVTRYSAKSLCNKHYQRLRKYGDIETNLAPKDLPLNERFWRLANTADPQGCWEWDGARNAQGYGMFQLSKGTCRRAHRVAFYLTHGHWPEPVCRHSCDNPPCVNPDHLLEGTDKENSADAVARNRRPRKYTDATLLAVKNAGGTNREIARQYGMDPSHVSRVKRFWEPGRGMPERV